MINNQVDVFISGAGPVGLVLAYHLTKMGISVFIVDAADKASPEFPMYGRACTLYPRTCEFLDQLDLYDDIVQQALVTNQTWAYDAKGERNERAWRIMQDYKRKTFFNSMATLRLKYSEDIFRSKLAEMGVEVHAPVRLQSFTINSQAEDDYQVAAVCEDSDGSEIKVRAKYIVGADGGGSTVRKLAEIPFLGERKIDHWVRIDGMVKSNIPEARIGVGAIESSTHGHVLWCPLDHGATRIGYTLTDALFQKYGTKMTAEQAAYEATIACAPWKVEFSKVDWHTVYGVQQHVAERFQDRERILIAGDAAHTHSSGSAQGMNVGMHDVTSLGWRLAGVIKGWYQPEVLANYSDERRGTALHLIRNDQIISSLISGKIPDYFKGRTEAPPVLLDEIMRAEGGFTVGLGVVYPANLLNDVSGSRLSITIPPGHRGPDALLRGPGLVTKTYKRLFDVTKFNGKFRVLVFTGDTSKTSQAIQSLRSKVDQDSSGVVHAVDFLTLIAGFGHVFDEYLGVSRFGNAFWDDHDECSAHQTYDIPVNDGAMVVLRPDGMIGHVAPLDAWEDVTRYLSRLVIPREQQKVVVGTGKATRKELGSYMSPDERNLAMPESKEEGIAVV